MIRSLIYDVFERDNSHLWKCTQQVTLWAMNNCLTFNRDTGKKEEEDADERWESSSRDKKKKGVRLNKREKEGKWKKRSPRGEWERQDTDEDAIEIVNLWWSENVTWDTDKNVERRK